MPSLRAWRVGVSWDGPSPLTILKTTDHPELEAPPSSENRPRCSSVGRPLQVAETPEPQDPAPPEALEERRVAHAKGRFSNRAGR